MIQEKGEEDYFFLHDRKMRSIMELVEDEFLRQDLLTSLSYYNQNVKKDIQKY